MIFKNNKTIAAIALAASILLTSCSSTDDTGGENTRRAPVSMTTAVTAITRSANADLQGTKLTPSAEVGIFAKNSDEVDATAEDEWKNVSYIVQADASLAASNQKDAIFYSLTSKPTHLYAYTPRIADANDLTAIQCNVKQDQTSDADYIASDLLISKAENQSFTTSAVQLSFTHALSKVVVKLTPGTGMTLDDFKGAKVTIDMQGGYNTVNLKTQATSDFVSDGTRKTITLHSFSADDITAAKNNQQPLLTAVGIVNTRYTCTEGDKITLTMADGATFSHVLSTTLTLSPNNAYVFDFTVNNIGIVVNTSIKDWDWSDNIDDGEFTRPGNE